MALFDFLTAIKGVDRFEYTRMAVGYMIWMIGTRLPVDENGKGGGKKLPMGVPSWKSLKKIDWEHIFDRHSDWGRVAKQSGKKTIFEGLSEIQIREVVQGAYKNIVKHGKMAEQGKYVLIGKYKSWTVEFIVNTATKTLETAYPKL
jgi:hypothetical protein